MAFAKATIAVILVLVSAAAQAQGHPVRTPEARVNSMCKGTTNPELCFKSILPRVASAKRFNIYNALEAEILATQEQVQKTTECMTAIKANPATDKSTRESMETCLEQYEMIKSAIQQSIGLVGKRNVGEARFKFSAVISYYSSCNDMFEDEVNPIASEAQGVYDLGGNCLDLMVAIQDRERRRHPA